MYRPVRYHSWNRNTHYCSTGWCNGLSGSPTFREPRHVEGGGSRAYFINDKWYGIIDGCHSHEALKELRVELPHEWCKLKWYVTMVKGGHSLEKYRQLACMQNERKDSNYYIETTHYDLLRGLRIEYDRLQAKNNKMSSTRKNINVKHEEVDEAYDGGVHQ